MLYSTKYNKRYTYINIYKNLFLIPDNQIENIDYVRSLNTYNK